MGARAVLYEDPGFPDFSLSTPYRFKPLEDYDMYRVQFQWLGDEREASLKGVMEIAPA